MRSDRVGARRRAVPVRRLAWFVLLVVGATVRAGAGEPFDRPGPTRATVVVSRVCPSAPAAELNSYGRLGTFYPTPYLMDRGNAPPGGSYSQMGYYGETSLSVYGPTSMMRTTSPPVSTYTRGYDGCTVVVPGTSFSSPNQPALAPVVDPTQARYDTGFRRSGTPPWKPSARNWIDQN